MTEVDQRAERGGPEGLSGWLTVVLFYLLLKICVNSLIIWGVLELMMERGNIFVSNYGLVGGAFALFLVIISLKTLVSLFKKSSEFPYYFRNFLILHVVFGLMTSLTLYYGAAPIEQIIPPTVRELIALWIGSAYLNQSTRVAATFTR